MKKLVIYTVLVGDYDEIRDPLVINDRFDYILFTDKLSPAQYNIWQKVEIPITGINNMLRSRYVKCHPTKVLGDYEASLYIDANIQIATPNVYERFFELLENGTEWAGIKHPDQGCVYEEICAIVDLKWVHDYDVVNWYGKMKKDGFPEGWGLYENSIIFRRHSPKIEAIGDLWWNTLMAGCKRDQFSLMYVLWKYQPSMSLFLPEGDCPRLLNSKDFVYYEHNPHKRILHQGILERLRRSSLRVSSSDLRAGYHDLFNRLSKCRNPKSRLFAWEMGAIIKYGYKVVANAISSRKK